MRFARRQLIGFEVAALECTGQAISKHSHDEFVIGANIVGREHIWLDGACLEAETDEVTLYNPGAVQAAEAPLGPWAFVSVYLHPDALEAQLGVSRQAAFSTPVLHSGHLARALKLAASRCLSGDATEGEASEALIVLCAALFGVAGTQTPAAKPRVSVGVLQAAERLSDDLCEPPTLHELAAASDLSPVQLVRGFARAFGLPPFAWLNVERLKRARQLLRAEQPISRVAAELGFADQAHFTRRFKQMYGVPPGRWQRG